jgi:hypothetical protein
MNIQDEAMAEALNRAAVYASVVDVAKKNAVSDFEELARDIGREFTNEDMAAYTAKGVDLRAAAAWLAENYSSGISFMVEMRETVARKGGLTDGQGRAVLNIVRNKMLGITRSATTIPAPSTRAYECYICKQMIEGYDPLMEHKRAHRAGEIDHNGDAVVSGSVIAVQDSKLGLDLSMLPDGRYAAPDLSGKNDLIFLMVRRVRKPHWRDRLYVYGKRIRGRERVQPGTIEVKEWSSDQKRLCGEQKVPECGFTPCHSGSHYHGEFEEQLQLILPTPESWAKLFGIMVGHCCICGKTLTDEDSRAQGIGPECVKKNNYFTTPPKSYIPEPPATATV